MAITDISLNSALEIFFSDPHSSFSSFCQYLLAYQKLIWCPDDVFDYPRFASTVFWYNLATLSLVPAPAVVDNFLIVLEAQLWSCHWSWTWSLTWTVPPPATWDRTRLNYHQDRWRQHSEQAQVLHFVLHHLISDLDLYLDGLGEVIWTYKEVFCYNL